MLINELYAIIKLVERCNLKCSYCYYYTDENSEVFQRPALMHEGVLDDLIDYVDRATGEMEIRRVVFAFHGGEPTLAKPDRVRRFCEAARARLEGRVEISFRMQTNGVFLSNEWLQLIEDERIGVGISVDGVKDVHDATRVDHRGRGSFERVAATIGTLRPLDAQRRVHLAAIAVMGESFSGVESYRHLVEELGLRRLKLLFVDRTAEVALPPEETERLGTMLCEVFDYWLLHHAQSVMVELFDGIVRSIVAKRHAPSTQQSALTFGFALLSDGRVRLSDDFMVAKSWFWSQTTLDVGDSSLSDFMSQRQFRDYADATLRAPSACHGCRHSSTCAGGELAHRYRPENGFDNPSVYCGALLRLYDHIERRLDVGEQRRPTAPAEAEDAIA